MSNIGTIEDKLLELADFEEVGSVCRAKEFITYAKRWILVSPVESEDQHNRLRFDLVRVENMMKRAQEFVAVNATNSHGRSSRVRFLGYGGHR